MEPMACLTAPTWMPYFMCWLVQLGWAQNLEEPIREVGQDIQSSSVNSVGVPAGALETDCVGTIEPSIFYLPELTTKSATWSRVGGTLYAVSALFCSRA
eukprot:245256-Amphidinium_carterae.1